VMCSQLPDNDNTSVTNMAEYLAAEVIEGYACPRPSCGSSITLSTRERSGSTHW
jgi:hypothetical protein